MAISCYLLFLKASSYWTGFAIPFILVSVLDIVAGISLIYQRPNDIIHVENYIKKEPGKIKTDEIPRMEKVMKNFVFYRYLEVALIFLGVILSFVSADEGFWRGLGLFIQASIVLTLDYFAERRGFIFIAYLNSISHE